MSSPPRLLDLFCGAGGCSVGYHRAGFEVTGVDIAPQPRYPWPERFVLADALEFLRGVRPGEWDFIHASPPCQAYTRIRHLTRAGHPALIEEVRALLKATGIPYVIENVPGAPLVSPIVLCGASFGLKTYRHRLFESSEFLFAPVHSSHREKCPRAGRLYREGGFMSVVGKIGFTAYAREVMGCPWMTGAELSQAIPPAYCEWIGRQLLQCAALEPAR
jgi:DNA (cytosine-5)-methyltransferase 1